MEQSPKKENIETIPVVDFVYDKEKDVTCLLELGPGGQFNPYPTKVYKQLIAEYGDNPTREQASNFIRRYLAEKDIEVPSFIEKCQTESKDLMNNFKKTAEQVFGLQIPEGTKAYLTVNNRCPYCIEENWFHATISDPDVVAYISMHELWHFYTWYKFGKSQENSGQINWKKYGDIKEALTVLLNPDCLDLLPRGKIDKGYPQHKELRERIADLWKKNPDIEFVWNTVWGEAE